MPPSAEVREEPTGSPRSAETGKRTILIYSPDLNFCFSLSMLFQDRYTVVTTTNPGLLENFVEHYAADLVVVDALPTEKMIERLQGLRSRGRRPPILMLYVCGPRDTALDALARRHVDSVMYKPFDVADMARRIAELLPR